MKCVCCISRRLACRGQLGLLPPRTKASRESRTAPIVQAAGAGGSRASERHFRLALLFFFSFVGQEKRIDGSAAMVAAAATPLRSNRLSTRPAISGELRDGVGAEGNDALLRSRFGTVAHRSDSFREQLLPPRRDPFAPG